MEFDRYVYAEDVKLYEGSSFNLEAQDRPRFRAEAGVTRFGKHPAMSYRIPGTNTSYTFTFKRNSKYHQLYQCQQCKSKGKWTGIHMINGEFATDPCSLPHHPECKPIRTAHNLVERTVYEFNRNVKADPSYAGKTPKPLWCEQANVVKEKAAEEPEIFEEMVAHHRKKGPKSRRTAIKRALRAHNDGSASADKENIADMHQ